MGHISWLIIWQILKNLILIGVVMSLINTMKINQANGDHKLFKSSCYTSYNIPSLYITGSIPATVYAAARTKTKTLVNLTSEIIYKA